MNDLRAQQIAVAFASKAGPVGGARLCSVCVSLLDVAGAGITLMGGTESGPVCCSNQRMQALEDLQFTLGEGPCRDAYVSRTPTLAPDLHGPSQRRWPAFTGLALQAQVEAVFAFPLITQKANVGVLTVYQDRAGDLTPTQHADGLIVAEVLAKTVLSLQATAAAGVVAAGIDGGMAHRAEVHQATGMVSLQLGVSIPEALIRIRAYAYANAQPINVVSADIVARRLRLDVDSQGAS